MKITRAQAPHQESLTFHKKISRTVEGQYLLYLPAEYRASKNESWPLVLFLHGAGERGTNIAKVTIHGPPKLVKAGRDFPFILVSPQCPANQRWADDVLLALLDDIAGKYRVDTNRVYVTGLSMGGYATWSLGITNPERFAAIAPVCGGGQIVDVLLANRTKASALRSLGVWAFHGAKDPVVKLEESERMVAALKQVGCSDVKLTVYPEAEHDSWTSTYENPEFYQWLLSHSRKPGRKAP